MFDTVTTPIADITIYDPAQHAAKRRRCRAFAVSETALSALALSAAFKYGPFHHHPALGDALAWTAAAIGNLLAWNWARDRH